MSLTTMHLTTMETETIAKFVTHLTECGRCMQTGSGIGPLRLCTHGTFLACKIHQILKARPDFRPDREAPLGTLW
jgi:hypothetical protein